MLLKLAHPLNPRRSPGEDMGTLAVLACSTLCPFHRDPCALPYRGSDGVPQPVHGPAAAGEVGKDKREQMTIKLFGGTLGRTFAKEGPLDIGMGCPRGR